MRSIKFIFHYDDRDVANPQIPAHTSFFVPARRRRKGDIPAFTFLHAAKKKPGKKRGGRNIRVYTRIKTCFSFSPSHTLSLFLLLVGESSVSPIFFAGGFSVPSEPIKSDVSPQCGENPKPKACQTTQKRRKGKSFAGRRKRTRHRKEVEPLNPQGLRRG